MRYFDWFDWKYLNRPWPFIFIGWGGLIPQEILFIDLNLWKTLVVLRLYLDRSDRSVPAGQATVPRPVRPLGQTGWCQFWLSTYAPLFFGKACVPKNTLLDQNCLRTMIINASAIFCVKGDKNYRPRLAFLQVDDETICFGLQTLFMATAFVGSTSTCCSIFSWLRKCCNLLFWV